MRPTDVRVTATRLYLLGVTTRVPLKFGAETLTSVTCARVALEVETRDGRRAWGWGETPLSVQWVWPSPLEYGIRAATLEAFCERLARAWAGHDDWGHALEVGQRFNERELPRLLAEFQQVRSSQEPMPLLAALVCNAAFDMALHDAFGKAAGTPVFETYQADFLTDDLAQLLSDGADAGAPGEPAVDFRGASPAQFLRQPAAVQLEAWHLVGGLDPLFPDELRGDEPDDGHPVLLADWIARDGLRCLKIKLRGNDAAWDYDRLVNVWKVAAPLGPMALTADFNCTVQDPAYVVEVLDRLEREHADLYEALLYVEQPFPYDLEAYPIDVRAVAARKPLLMDESADSWRHVREGTRLGWNGVALKTCKTLSGALLSLCWARAHGLHLMVQDLTNPMLAQIAHLQLAAHTHTLRGVESNSMQFYPAASDPEARLHPGIYRRRGGQVDLSTLVGPGMGYAGAEAARSLPEPVCAFGS